PGVTAPRPPRRPGRHLVVPGGATGRPAVGVVALAIVVTAPVPGLTDVAQARAENVALLATLLAAWDRKRRRGPFEIAAGAGSDAGAELAAQVLGLDLLGFALGEVTEAEGAEVDPDQAIDAQAKMAEHVAHLAVLALADRERKPDVGAGLVALDARLNW